jgi:glycosyltransferase involved in cell wall biosynthesis
MLNALGDSLILHDRFIADEDVKYYFSVADALVLPYKTATQSGVTQIAYNFCTPMVVTRVGGLPEIVPDDVVGYVCPSTVDGVAKAIDDLYQSDNIERFRRNIVEERKRFSWSAMCDKLVEVFRSCQTR